jgi:hypothetical protein
VAYLLGKKPNYDVAGATKEQKLIMRQTVKVTVFLKHKIAVLLKKS